MGRLRSIELFNFKSYRGKQTVELGDAFFTSIIGPNGSGKSNMMDAISFVLGVRSKQLRSDHLDQLVYRGRILSTDNEDEEESSSNSPSQQTADPNSCYVKLVYEKSSAEVLELKRT